MEVLCYYLFRGVILAKSISNELTNKQFNNILVLERDLSKKNTSYYFCKCLKCGKIISKSKHSIIHGTNYSCGCLGYLDSDLKGKTFGPVKVLDFYKITPHKEKMWKCQCECGNICYKTSNQLTKGYALHCLECGHKITSLKTSKPKKHSQKLYECWINMKTRVTNKKQDTHNRYINRNIKMCDEWLKDYYIFEKWALENGYKDNLTIDRIDNNGNYCPENCRWVDRTIQANNRRTNVRLEYNNETKTMMEWSRELNIPYYYLQKFHKQKSMEEMVNGYKINSRHKRKSG